MQAVGIHHRGFLHRHQFRKRVAPLDVAEGLVVISGKNGSGKSTMLEGLKLGGRRWWPFRPTRVLANPDLQVVARDLASLLSRCIAPTEIARVDEAARLLAAVLQSDPRDDVLDLSYATKKLLAVVVAALNRNPGLAVDEPFTGLDEGAASLTTFVLEYSVKKLRKTVVVTSPEDAEGHMVWAEAMRVSLD